MMSSYVDTGDMAPLMVFYNGPGSSIFGNIIISYYGTGYTPSFFCDGVWSDVGWDQTACENAIDARLAEPSYLDIDITVGGDENAGVVYYNITAEQDLQAGGLIRLLSAVIESDITAGGTWGNYNGQTVHWIPRQAPVGNAGITLNFTGPYPQTISVQGEYTIDPGWDFENMGIVAFVMDYDGKEVFNAFYSEDLGSIMGIEAGSDAVSMTIGPNPSTGNFSVTASLPDGVHGTVDVFDITGRVVGSASTDSAEFSVEEAGLYLVRLSSPAGDSITKSVIVVR